MSIQENVNTSIQNNFNYYNKNKEKDNIYYVDEEENEYRLGEKIKSEKVSDDELKELEDYFKKL